MKNKSLPKNIIVYPFLLFIIVFLTFLFVLLVDDNFTNKILKRNDFFSRALRSVGIDGGVNYENSVPEDLEEVFETNDIDINKSLYADAQPVDENILFVEFEKYDSGFLYYLQDGTVIEKPVTVEDFSYVCTNQEIKGTPVYNLDETKEIIFIKGEELNTVLEKNDQIILGLSTDGMEVNFVAGNSCFE